MIIETNEKFTKEEIDEVFAITVKRTQIYKTPEKPLKDPFKEAVGNIIWGVCAFVVNLILCLFANSSPFKVICIVAMTLSGVLISFRIDGVSPTPMPVISIPAARPNATVVWTAICSCSLSFAP